MKRLSFRPIPYDSVVAAQVNQLHRIHSISLRFFNISFSVLTIRFSPGCRVERRFDALLTFCVQTFTILVESVFNGKIGCII